MVALIIAILVISIVVLVVYNLSISRKLTSWKNFKDKLVNNIEVVQDFITMFSIVSWYEIAFNVEIILSFIPSITVVSKSSKACIFPLSRIQYPI